MQLFRLLGSAALFVAILFCPSVGAEPQRALISGTVTDVSGMPVISAYVTLYAGFAPGQALSVQRTDDSGNYRFESLSLDIYTLKIEAVGLEASSATIDLRPPASGTAVRDVVLPKTRAVLRAPYVKVPILFATDRAILSQSSTIAFANNISGDASHNPTLTYGKLFVDVPANVPRPTVSDNPVLAALQALFRSDTADLPVLEEDSVQTLKERAFDLDLAALINESSGGHALVFIHGYDTSFQDAACNAAEISYALRDFRGPTLLYSWSSRHRKDLYLADKRNNDLTRDSLQHFLLNIASTPGINRVDIVAHSMGNQALTDVLLELSRDNLRAKAKLGEIVLAAPDVDAALFSQHAPEMARVASRVTLYSSRSDSALTASYEAWHAARVGNTDPPLTVAPVETIDATLARTDLIGHGYFIGNPEITEDINLILLGKTLPRAHISGVTPPLLWRFSP